MNEQQEHYAQFLMDSIWDVVAQSSQHLSAHEILGILETVQMKISFDHNVRAANEEVKRMRDANRPAPTRDPNSPIIDKHGFPIE